MAPISPICVATDPSWPLSQWLTFIDQQIERHGVNATLCTNAGANNVELMVLPVIDNKTAVENAAKKGFESK